MRSSSDEQANWRATNLISVNQFAILHEFGLFDNGHLG